MHIFVLLYQNLLKGKNINKIYLILHSKIHTLNNHTLYLLIVIKNIIGIIFFLLMFS